MSVYKVPQDVEAEDKLLGPFSFKQFIFLLISAMGIALAYGLSKILMPLAIIPMPFVLLFGVLALPIKKDQPMEVYLAAVISFIFKPKIRLWKSDGIESIVKIVAPKIDEPYFNKEYGRAEVDRRLSYLANLVDSEGWAVRGITNPSSPMRQELYNEAQAVDDLLDENNSRTRQIDSLMSQSNMRRRQEMIYRMHNPSQAPQPAQPASPTYTNPQQQTPPQAVAPLTIPAPTNSDSSQPANADEPVLTIDPYPSDMKQSVLSPVGATSSVYGEQAQTTSVGSDKDSSEQAPQIQPEPKASISTVSPAIMNLASNKDLSIEVIQREANRIDKRVKEIEEEVVISLR